MACQYFEDGSLCLCRAVRGLLVPSLFERERYCLTGEPARCPTHQARTRRGESLPEELYYSLWLPEREPDPAAEGAVPEEHTAGGPL